MCLKMRKIAEGLNSCWLCKAMSPTYIMHVKLSTFSVRGLEVSIITIYKYYHPCLLIIRRTKHEELRGAINSLYSQGKL